jgi:hypothetical protein
MDLINALLMKLGGDLAATTHSRVVYALEIVRESFPFETQVPKSDSQLPSHMAAFNFVQEPA